jgi:hypothetical protein
LAGGTLGASWPAGQGRGWSVRFADDSYRITADPGAGMIWGYRTLDRADVTIGVDVSIDRSANAGLLLRYDDSSNYVSFLIDPTTGDYRVIERRNGTETVIVEGTSAAVRGTTVRLVAQIRDDTLRIAAGEANLGRYSLSNASNSSRFGMVVLARESTATAQFRALQIREIK